jgi:hypothetical protein
MTFNQIINRQWRGKKIWKGKYGKLCYGHNSGWSFFPKKHNPQGSR